MLMFGKLLESQHRNEYLDRALDVLIAFESGDQELEHMEPFLRFIEAFPRDLSRETSKKAEKVFKRMLGPAQRDKEKLRVLSLLSTLNRADLLVHLKSQLQQLTQSDNDSIATNENKLLDKNI